MWTGEMAQQVKAPVATLTILSSNIVGKVFPSPDTHTVAHTVMYTD